MNFQSLKTWFLKEQDQQRIQICNDFHLFFYCNGKFKPYTLACNKINMKKKIIIMKTFNEKGLDKWFGFFGSLTIPWGGS